MPLGFQIRVLPCGLWRANHAPPRCERPLLTPVDGRATRFAHYFLKVKRSLTTSSFDIHMLFCESSNFDIFLKPACLASLETYDTAFNAH